MRRYAAEQLYTLLLALEPDEGGTQDAEGAMALVEATAWDGPLAAARDARAQAFRLLGLPEPVAVGGGAAAAAAEQRAAAQQQAVDENASYAALLTHAMRGL